MDIGRARRRRRQTIRGSSQRKTRKRNTIFESLEPRWALNAAPVAHDDAFQVLQDTPLTVANSVVTPSPAAFPGLAELKSLSLNYAAAQIEYSQPYHLLFVRPGGTAVHVIDLTTNTEISVEKPKATFTDLDTTFDGRYLYVADYGGTNIGYGTPSSPSYVHRFDASTPHLGHEAGGPRHCLSH